MSGWGGEGTEETDQIEREREIILTLHFDRQILQTLL